MTQSSMTQSELVTQLATRFPQFASKKVAAAIRMMLGAMSEALASGQRVEIRGIGSLSLKQRPAREARNPKSGQKVSVPAKAMPHFKPSKKLCYRCYQVDDEPT